MYSVQELAAVIAVNHVVGVNVRISSVLGNTWMTAVDTLTLGTKQFASAAALDCANDKKQPCVVLELMILYCILVPVLDGACTAFGYEVAALMTTVLPVGVKAADTLIAPPSVL